MPPTMKRMILKLRDLHSRVLCLFDVLPDSDHEFWVDNMHASMNFVAKSLNHKAHVMLEGACRKGGRSFLDMCKRDEVKGVKNIREVMRTIKVTELAA